MFLRSLTGKSITAPRRCRPLFVLRTFFPFHRENSQFRMTKTYLPNQNDKKSICQASLNQGGELFTFFSDLLSFLIFNWEITYI